MSELLKKYESIDQSKLNEATVKILSRVKTLTADFTADDAKNNEIAKKVLDEVMKKNPSAIKIVKREPKAKAKKVHKAKGTHKATHAPAKTAENNIMALAKSIRKDGESFKEAMERAKQQLKERKEKAVQKQKTELEKLYELVKTKKELQGFANSDIRRDSVRDAKPRGRRVVTKEGTTSNQYGTFSNKLGRKYWETRDRHADRLAPNYPKDMPLLASGGSLQVEDSGYGWKNILGYEPYFDKNVTVATFSEEQKIVRPSHGYFYPNPMAKKVIRWAKKNGYDFVQDGKKYESGGAMNNMTVHNGTDFFNTPVYADGGMTNLTIQDVSFADGGSVKNERLFYFLKDDLQELEEAIKSGNMEEVNRFFSYWGQHLNSLKTKNNERMFNFLEEDLEKLQEAVENGDTEEVERFFSYWGQHLESINMAKGGGVRPASEIDKIFSEKGKVVEKLTPKEVADMWNKNSFGVKEGISKPMTEEEAKNPIMKMYLRNLLIENELTEDEYSRYFQSGGALPFMTDPNFGNFQNAVLENGGSMANLTEQEFIKKYWGANVFTENPSQYFEIKKMSSSNDDKIDAFVKELKADGFTVKKRAYSDFTSVMGVKKKASYELGGAFMNTDLAGHTGGGTGGLDPNAPLSGVSGTYYTGLVGETGAMSSGELFMDGGAMAQNQQVINDASQSYVNYYLGEGAGQGIYKDGGAIKNQYEGRTPEDIWNSLSKQQRGHFLYDHVSEIEEYKNIEKLPSSEIIKAYNSEWSSLDKDIKNRFTNHTREGQYAYGGKTKSQKSMRTLMLEQIASMTGTIPARVETFADEHNLTDDDLSNLMTGIGRGMVKRADFVEALVGRKNNSFEKSIVAFAKSDKAYKMADGGMFNTNVHNGTAFMDNAYFAKGGFVGTVKFNVGDTVWQKDEKRYATVMNNYGDPINGDYGDIRLDTTGNTSIYTFDRNRKSPATVGTATGYNLVKVGEKGDTGKFTPDVLSEMKESANRLIDMRRKSKDKEGVVYYQEVYKRLLDGEFDSMAKGSAKPTKYIDHDDIKSVSFNVKGNTIKVSGDSVLNGANMFEDGGDLTKIANYIPKRDVVEVELKDGSKVKPVNGYWLKKDWKTTSAKAGYIKEPSSGGSNEDFKIGDYVKKTEKQGSITYGSQGFIYEINRDFSEIKLEDEYGNKNPKWFKLKGFRKLKSKSKSANVGSFADGGMFNTNVHNGTAFMDNTFFDNGGGVGFDPIKVKVVMAVGLDRAIEFYDAEYPIRPYQLLEKAVRKGFITLDEINERVVESALETGQDSEDMEEVGSSDETYAMQEFLDEAGFNVGFVDGRLTRTFADGGMFEDNDGFMRMANGNNYRMPNRPVHVDTIDEPIDLKDNVSVQTNEVVIQPLSEDIDLSQRGGIRARMGYNPKDRSPEKLLAVNPRAFEYMDLPMPTSHKHKND